MKQKNLFKRVSQLLVPVFIVANVILPMNVDFASSAENNNPKKSESTIALSVKSLINAINLGNTRFANPSSSNSLKESKKENVKQVSKVETKKITQIIIEKSSPSPKVQTNFEDPIQDLSKLSQIFANGPPGINGLPEENQVSQIIEPPPTPQQEKQDSKPTQTDQPAPDNKPDTQAAKTEQPTPDNKPDTQAVKTEQPTPDNKPDTQAAKTEQPAPDNKPDTQAAGTEQPAPDNKPDTQAAETDQPAPDNKPDTQAAGTDQPSPENKPDTQTAKTDQPKQDEKQVQESPKPNNNNEPKELEDFRSSNTQRYQNSDGSYTEKIFFDAVNYKDLKSGKWLPIDSSLNLQLDGTYHNKANSFDVSLPKKLKDNFTKFTLNNGISLGFKPTFSNDASGIVDKNNIVYSNIAQNTDISYSMVSNGLKESIILKSPQTPTNFSFKLDLPNLTYKFNDDKSISFF